MSSTVRAFLNCSRQEGKLVGGLTKVFSAKSSSSALFATGGGTRSHAGRDFCGTQPVESDVFCHHDCVASVGNSNAASIGGGGAPVYARFVFLLPVALLRASSGPGALLPCLLLVRVNLWKASASTASVIQTGWILDGRTFERQPALQTFVGITCMRAYLSFRMP